MRLDTKRLLKKSKVLHMVTEAMYASICVGPMYKTSSFRENPHLLFYCQTPHSFFGG